MFLDLFRNYNFFRKTWHFLQKKLSPWVQFHRTYTDSRVLSIVVITVLNLVHSFLSPMSRYVLEFISKFQIVFEKYIIFRVWTYIIIQMGEEYLSRFKRLKAKEQARQLSVMNLKNININVLCALSLWNPLWKHSYHRKKAPCCSTDFWAINN